MAGSITRWGVSVLDWFAPPIISRLLKRGFAHLNYDATEKMKVLDIQVLELMQVTEVVDQRTYREQLESLLNGLKSALYKAEDILDSVEYESLKKQIDDAKFDGNMSPRRTAMVTKKLGSAMTSLTLNHEECDMLNVELEKTLKNIESFISDASKVLEQFKFLSLREASGRKVAATISPSAVSTALPPSRVFGRDQDLHKIIATLHEKEDHREANTVSGTCYSVIGIHGTAGSGKSTLAHCVYHHQKKYNEEKMEGHFDLFIWIHVSEVYDLDSIFMEMYEGATQMSCPEFNSRDSLKKDLENKLRGKRILLVLDDVWKNISREELRQLHSPLNVGKAGSIVLATSRTEAALVALGAVKERCFPISSLDDEVFLQMFMHYALANARIPDHDRRELEMIGKEIAKKLHKSPLAARTVGSQLRVRLNVNFWRNVNNREVVNETMGALWWSYMHLDEQIRRCFAYCSIFPRRYRLKRDELVRLWVAEGFINTSKPEEEMEDVAQYYFDELLSASFLHLGGKEKLYEYEREVDYFIIHDLLYDLAEEVSGKDCFRIERGGTGEIAEDVRYLFVGTYNRDMITKKISKLHNLRTLIIDDIILVKSTEWEAFASMFSVFTGLQKLRVLKLHVSGERSSSFSFPDSIGQLKHLRYFTFLVGSNTDLTLPAAFTKLYHMQVVDFGYCIHLTFSSGEDYMNLVNLRRVISKADLDFPNVGRLTWLQTLPFFTIKKKQGYESHQLKHLNKLEDKLQIHGLDNVQCKEEALEVNLPGKEKLKDLVLQWDNGSSSSEVQAEVLEGLCPPKYLERLGIMQYHGTTLPNWMTGNYNGGPENLEELRFHGWSQRGIAPDLGAFIHLHSLCISNCSWNALPGNMEHLISLEKLEIKACMNMWALATLPMSLKEFTVLSCNHKFMRSCITINHPNFQKIAHIPKKTFEIGEGPFGRRVPFV